MAPRSSSVILEKGSHGMTVLRPAGVAGALDASNEANDLKRPMNSAFVACDMYVPAAGVRFAVKLRPHGPFISHPPANGLSAMSPPLSSCGVWHSWHPPIVARYFPYSTVFFGSGVLTGASTGCGANFTKRFTGKSMCLAGTP